MSPIIYWASTVYRRSTFVWGVGGPYLTLAGKSACHRRRIELEDKAKVLGWIGGKNPCRASCFASVFLKQTVELNRLTTILNVLHRAESESALLLTQPWVADHWFLIRSVRKFENLKTPCCVGTFWFNWRHNIWFTHLLAFKRKYITKIKILGRLYKPRRTYFLYISWFHCW